MGPVAQMVGGVQPALFGAPMQNAKTAAVYSQARDQALGSLSITYGPLKTFLASITEKAVTIAENREGDINEMVPNTTAGGYKDTTVSIDKLKAGRYKCKPVVDDGGIPESPSAQKAGLMNMIQFMGQSPQFQAILQHPDNQYFLKQNSGLKGFEIPGADSRNKQLREIEELLQGEVVMPDQADIQKVAQHDSLTQAAGGTTSNAQPQDLMQSSVPVDPDVDDNQVEMQECLHWLISDEGQQAKVFNPKGYQNVRQHMLEHKRALQDPTGAKPLQDRIPNPQQAMLAAQTSGAMQEHAQQGGQPQQTPMQPSAVAGGPPAPQALGQ
jgi:hypothetical protein